jgi:hypothetical protein
VRDHKIILAAKFLLAILAVLLLTDHAMAYIGPGAGLEFIGYFSSLLGLMIAAFSTMLLWPVYAFLRWLRCSRDNPPAILQPSESGVMER